VLFVLGDVVDGARGIHRDARSAERVLVELLTERALDHRRTRRKDLRGAFHHDGPVRENRPHRRTAGRRAHDGAHDRYDSEQIGRAFAAVAPITRNDGVSLAACAVDGAAGAIDQIHERDAVFEGEIFYEPALTALTAVGAEARSRAYRVILAADRNGTSIDLADAHHIGCRLEARELSALVIGRAPGDLSDFPEAALIQKRGDALAHRELARGVMLRDRSLAAAGFGQFAPAMDLLDLDAPAHHPSRTATT
jgi:hypothetical protein